MLTKLERAKKNADGALGAESLGVPLMLLGYAVVDICDHLAALSSPEQESKPDQSLAFLQFALNERDEARAEVASLKEQLERAKEREANVNQLLDWLDAATPDEHGNCFLIPANYILSLRASRAAAGSGTDG